MSGGFDLWGGKSQVAMKINSKCNTKNIGAAPYTIEAQRDIKVMYPIGKKKKGRRRKEGRRACEWDRCQTDKKRSVDDRQRQWEPSCSRLSGQRE